jgi:hypothetical protein
MPNFDDTPYVELETPARGDVQGVVKDISEALPENQTKFITFENKLQFGAWASTVRAVTASGSVTLANTDPMFIEIDPNGSNRDVNFPAKSDDNHAYLVLHSGSANTLTFKRSGGATITTLSAGEAKYIMPSTIEDFTALAGGSGAATGLPVGFMFGLTLSNNGSDATNDIDIATGKARDGGDTADIALASALTKRLDASWAVGTNQGGLDTGSIADTTYHVWLIKRSDTAVVDVLFSTSASAPTMPANYDLKRRIGSIVRVSGAIRGFVQDGDEFMWKVPIRDVNATNPGTSAVTRTLTVPIGIRVKAILSVLGASTSVAADNPQGIWISDLSQTDTAPSTSIYNLSVYTAVAGITQLGAYMEVWTNTSGQVRSRIQVSTANTLLNMTTNGWIDHRGRLA